MTTADAAARSGPARRVPRRRPSGAPPPLPRHLRRTGVGWLIAALVAVVVTVVVMGEGVSGAAIPVIVVDDTVVRWISDRDLPGIDGVARVISYAVVVVGDPDRGLADRRGVDRLAPVASPGDRTGGDAARRHAARLRVRRDHPAPSVRRHPARELGWLVDAVAPDARAHRVFRDRPLHAGPGRPCAQSIEVAGRGVRHRGRPRPAASRGRLAERHHHRRPHLDKSGRDGLSDLRSERGVPGDVPPGSNRPPRRHRRPWRSDPQGGRGAAVPHRVRRRAGGAERIGGLDPAAATRRRHVAAVSVRQAVLADPPALGPLVQARSRAAVRPVGGREAVQHRAPPRPTGGLRAARVPRRRRARSQVARLRRTDARTRVPAGHRVPRRRPSSSATPTSTTH